MERVLRGFNRELHELVLGIYALRCSLVFLAFSAYIHSGNLSGFSYGESDVCDKLLCERDTHGICHHLGISGKRQVNTSLYDIPFIREFYAGKDRNDAGDKDRGDGSDHDRHGNNCCDQKGYVF